MIQVHHLNNSRSQRILWLLEELGEPYEVVRYQRDPRTLLGPASLKAVHPLGKAPLISDGEVTVAESGAIIEYLLARNQDHGLLPLAGSEAHRQYRFWLHYAEGSLMPLLLVKLVCHRMANAPMAFFARPVARALTGKVLSGFVGPGLETQMAFIEAHLAANPWFAGQAFSGADVQMSFPLEATAAREDLSERYPGIYAFVQRIQARPAYRRALVEGGAYDYLLEG